MPFSSCSSLRFDEKEKTIWGLNFHCVREENQHFFSLSLSFLWLWNRWKSSDVTAIFFCWFSLCLFCREDWEWSQQCRIHWKRKTTQKSKSMHGAKTFLIAVLIRHRYRDDGWVEVRDSPLAHSLARSLTHWSKISLEQILIFILYLACRDRLVRTPTVIVSEKRLFFSSTNFHSIEFRLWLVYQLEAK